MKYLITGAGGFVGTYLIEEIRTAEPDATIVSVDRVPPASLAVDSSHAVDLLDLGALTSIFERELPDFVVHLASLSSVAFSWQEPVESFSNNTNIFLNVLECVRRHCRKTRVLSIGSSEQYGVVDPTALPLTEERALHPASPYAVARVAQEQLGDVYARGFGLDVVNTRSFNHVGPGQTDRFVVSAIAKQFADFVKGRRTDLVTGDTSVIRDFLDVRDVVTAYHSLLRCGKTANVYNVCSGRGVSIDGVIDLFEAITGAQPRRHRDASLVRPVENPVVIGSHAKLAREVGWSPKYSLEDTLRATFRFWLEKA